MKSKVSKFLNITLPLLLGVFLVYYAYSSFTSEQLEIMKGHFKNANYNYIVVATFFSIVSLWSRAYRWNFALEYMGYKSKTSTNLMAISIGYIMNLTLPRSGEFSRALIVQKYEKIPFDKGFGTIVSERVVDLVCLLLCVFTVFVFQYKVLKDFLLERIPVQKLLVFGVVLFCCFVVGVLVFLYSNWKPVLFVKRKIAGLIEGVVSIFKMPKKGVFLLHTAIIWITYILTFYFGIFALEETSTLGFGMIMAAFVAGSFAVSFTNGGFGAFPLIISELLLFYGISQEAGTAFGWILWSSQTGLVVVMGALSFLVLPLLYRNKN